LTFFGESHADDIICGRRFTDLIADLLVRESMLLVNAFKYPWYTYLYRTGLLREHRELANDIKNMRDYCKSLITKRKKEIINAIK